MTKYSDQSDVMFSDSVDQAMYQYGSGDQSSSIQGFTSDDEDFDGSGSGTYTVQEGSGTDGTSRPHEPVISMFLICSKVKN